MSVHISRGDLRRIVVAIDPAVSVGEDSDLTGIVVAGRGPHQPDTCKLEHCPGHGYVLDDLSCKARPQEWASTAIAAYDKWQADRVVAEVNNGGDMVGTTLHAVRLGIPYQAVTATRGKRIRAEPVAALWEQGRVHLVGSFPKLEDQLTTWTPEQAGSPDRLDALVWAITALGLVGGQGQAFLAIYKDEAARQQASALVPAGPDLGVHLVGYEPPVLRKGCKHRFFAGQCVNCGGQPTQGEP